MSDEKETAAAGTVRPSRDPRPAHRSRRDTRADLLGVRQPCAEDDLACGNGTIRAPAPPVELFGDDWLE